MKIAVFGLSVALALSLSACGQKGSGRCVDAGSSPAQIGAHVTGSGVTAGRSAAVKSKAFSSVYMVAVELTIDGQKHVGVWATNSLQGSGTMFSVDGVAHQFSDFTRGDQSPAGITQSTDGVADVKDCLS